MKPIQPFYLVLAGVILLAANVDAGRWITRDPMDILEHMERDPHPLLDLNPYRFVLNNPVNNIDPTGLWTCTIGGHAGYGFIVGGGISGGFSFGHGTNGWSFGFLGGPFLGSGGPASVSAGGFAQFTTADTVSQLKGIGGQVGGSFGEGITAGGDFVFGQGYVGGQATIGIGGGLPAEIHGGGTVTIGWTSK
jgi:hypothetical protein